MSVATQKPPTQIAGVVGIAPKPIELTPAAIDWPRVAGLPPFQMFMGERFPGKTQDGWPQPTQDLFDDYCQWHGAKGYWPNETPTGELKG